MTGIIHRIKNYKLNIFDVLVVLAIALVAVFFLYLRFSKKTEWVTIRLSLSNDDVWFEGQPPQYWYADSIKKGMVTRNTLGDTVAEIVNVSVFDNGGYRRRAFVDIKLKVTYDKQQEAYLYNYQPLQIGKALELAVDNNSIKGLVTHLNNENNEVLPLREKVIELKSLAVKPWVADKLVQGLEMKDSEGRVLAVIEKIDKQNAEWSEFSDIRGQMIKVTNPELKDLTIQLRVKTFESGGVIYFVDRAALKVGDEIWFQFPEIAIKSATISRIIE